MRQSRAGVVRGILAAAVVMAAPALPLAGQTADRLAVRAENPLPAARTDETIAIAWSALRQRIPSLNANAIRVVEAGTGNEVVSQVLDGNADGAPDSLLFQSSFGPREARSFLVEPVAPTAQAASRVFAMHDDYRDDVAWESDRIAWRIYGQGLWEAEEFEPLVSSGIDVWLKSVRTPIVEKWYGKGHDAYHIDTGEGADFYTVGATLGAGGTAIWKSGQMFRAKNFKTHRIIANGPIRAIFELDYEPWDAGGTQVAETKRVSIDAGSNLFRQEIRYRGPTGEIQYVTGTVKRAGIVGTTSRANTWAWQSTWGPVERKNGGHGRLGTAVLLPANRLQEIRENGDHYFMVATARAGEPAVHYTGAGWTDSGDFRSVEDWWAYLDAFARRLEQPVKVTIGAPASGR
jgi:pectinesterase